MRFYCFYMETYQLHMLLILFSPIGDHHDKNNVRTTRARLNECMVHIKTVCTHLRS